MGFFRLWALDSPTPSARTAVGVRGVEQRCITRAVAWRSRLVILELRPHLFTVHAAGLKVLNSPTYYSWTQKGLYRHALSNFACVLDKVELESLVASKMCV